MDGQSFESIAVDQDLLIEHLEKIEKIGDRIKIKVVGESEKLKAGVVNLNAISEFRNRVKINYFFSKYWDLYVYYKNFYFITEICVQLSF